MANFRRLGIQRLDDRRLLAAFGLPWPEATSLTLSFAPDGTAFGQQSSALFRTLDKVMPTRQWEQQILQAFQTWGAAAGIDIGLVADRGQAFGTTGLKEGDPRFGDIRIGALPMAGDVLAVANPFDPFVANTSVGDVYLNSSVAFSAGGAGASYDLFSVLLHEAGHVLGLDHNPDPGSVMFENFRGVRAGLSAQDVAAVQTLYGKRADAAPPDQSGHDTIATASTLNWVAPTNGSSPIALTEGDFVAPGDSHVYRLDLPAASQSVEIQLKAAGMSLLEPQLTVYNAAGAVVKSAVAVDPFSNNLEVAIDRVMPGDTYYVKIAPARSDVFGVGRYRLEVAAHRSTDAPAPQNGSAPPSAGTGHSPLDNVQLLSSTPGYVEHTYYEIAGSLDRATGMHVYQVRSADVGPNLANVMTVVVTTSDGQDDVRVAVRDDHGLAVASRTVFTGNGRVEIQVPSVDSNRDYLVELSRVAGSSHDTNFAMDVDFDQDTGNRHSIAAGLLDSGENTVTHHLSVTQSDVLHFALAASHWNTDARADLQMTILDEAGHAVYRLDVADGAFRSGDVFLSQGQYQVRFERGAGAANAPLRFELSGFELSDPLGPQLHDATREPLASTSASALSQLNFYWLSLRASDAAPAAAANLVARQATLGAGTPPETNAPPLALPPGTPLSATGIGLTGAVARRSTALRPQDDSDADSSELTTDGALPLRHNAASGADGPATASGRVKPSPPRAGSASDRDPLPAARHPATGVGSPRSGAPAAGAPAADEQDAPVGSAASIESGAATDALIEDGWLSPLRDVELGLTELAGVALACQWIGDCTWTGRIGNEQDWMQRRSSRSSAQEATTRRGVGSIS